MDHALKCEPGNVLITGSDADLVVTRIWTKVLDAAQKLLSDGHDNVAVVLAVTATETITERAIAKAFELKGITETGDAVDEFILTYSLGGERKTLRKLYVSLTGDEIQDQPFWGNFKEATKTRNTVVHKGIEIIHADAVGYVKACENVVKHIESKNDLA